VRIVWPSLMHLNTIVPPCARQTAATAARPIGKRVLMRRRMWRTLAEVGRHRWSVMSRKYFGDIPGGDLINAPAGALMSISVFQNRRHRQGRSGQSRSH
jgi:hypothetical protein